ncbi:MAG: gamma-glutamyltransferase [Woeseiaceae bacterium]|nr:gamma-glutamyltransferase [Woeseiaceae bacterium]
MKNLTKTVSALAVILMAGCNAPEPGDAPQAAPESVQQAAIAMPDAESARVAAEVLRAGGNAVDAAIAAEFVLAVTLPEAGNIGGGGFMLSYIAGEPYFLDYRETAPLAAHRDMYLDADGNVIRGASTVGHLAVGVPGTVAGLWEAHRRFGTLPWRDLVMPSILLARDGFVVHPQLALEVLEERPRFAGKTNFANYFGGMKSGEMFRQPELAETLQRIADDGIDGFYGGRTADLIVDDMVRNNGLITHEDLQRYRAIWREPLRAEWRDLEILAAPPPSSGGFAVIQLLKIKDLLAHEFEDVPHNSAQYVHLFAEMLKRVFADRAEYLGDPDYYDVPLDRLLSDDYLRRRAAEVKPDRISTIDEARPGLESMQTTHYSIVDGDGNAVSTTTTLNLSFGSGVVVEGAGFLLNDEMDDFSVKPGVPNAYGVIGNIANEIQPGKRMLSSMSPTIILNDGKVDFVVGTPGGTTIFTTVFQMIVNNYDFGMSPLQSAGAPRFHHQLPQANIVTYSPTVPLPDETISQLSELGYRTVPHPYNYGDVQTIYRADNQWLAASDPRKRGQSLVVEIQQDESGDE